MNRLVLYSGGLSSFMTAVRVIAAHGKKDVKLIFCDTKTEDEDLYRFLNETQEHLGVPMVSLADGRDIWGVFTDEKFMGNSRIDPCSKILKRQIFEKWLGHHTPKDTILYYGIGWQETHRLKALVERWAPFPVSAPLTDEPLIGNKEVIEYLDGIGIKPPRLYAMGFQHNNCGGFCVKTGQANSRCFWKSSRPDTGSTRRSRRSCSQRSVHMDSFVRQSMG